MNPELEQLKKQVEELTRRLDSFNSSTTIPFDVGEAFKARSNVGNLGSAPLASVTAPSGGATVDGAARTAINSVITRLEDLGLISAN